MEQRGRDLTIMHVEFTFVFNKSADHRVILSLASQFLANSTDTSLFSFSFVHSSTFFPLLSVHFCFGSHGAGTSEE